jgi:hypothetical protein
LLKDVDLREVLEKLAGKMGRCAVPRVAEGKAARLYARLRDDIAERLEWRIGAYHQDVGRRGEPRNRREAFEGVVGKLLIQKRVGGMAACHHHERIAIGRRGCERLGSDDATGPRPVFDNDGLAPLPRDHIAQRSRQNIHPASGRIWHKDTHRVGRKRRLRDGRAGESKYRCQRRSHP